MFKLFINHVQIGNYETAEDLNKSVHNVFAYAEVTDMKLIDEDGATSVMLTQKGRS